MTLKGDPEAVAGTVIGEYEVRDLLGRGGFGAVYRAVHPLIGKQVAIKVLSPKYSADPEMVSRFMAEARAVNQIRHQHIIDVFSFGHLPDGRHYYVMELLDGEPLDEYLRTRGPLPVEDALALLRPIALALDAAHAAGIAHRDLKPENVFIARDAEGRPFPKLLDFGLAKLLGPDAEVDHSTRSGAMMGTPRYMSPEQCRGRDVDHRTDYYAFGVMTYQMLTGGFPFTGADHVEIIFKQISDTPVAPSRLVPSLPEAVDAAVLALMEKDPAARPTSAVEAVRALAIAAGLPPGAPAPVSARLASTSGRGSGIGSAPAAGRGSMHAPGGTLTDAPRSVASLPMGELSSASSAAPQTGARRPWLYPAVALVVAGSAFGVWRMTQGSSESGTVAAPSPPVSAPPPPPVAQSSSVDASVVDSAPARVTIEIVGVPEGTIVKTADGVILGSAPGKLLVDRSDRVLELRLEHDGYKPRTDLKIRPSADLPALRVSLERRATTTTPPPRGGKPSEIGEFGKDP